MISIVFYVINGIFVLAKLGDKDIEELGDKLGDKLENKKHAEALAKGVIYATGAVFIILALVNVYFWLCVFSFLKELKSRTIPSPA